MHAAILAAGLFVLAALLLYCAYRFVMVGHEPEPITPVFDEMEPWKEDRR